MTRQFKLTIATTAGALVGVPLLLFALEIGPDAGFTGVPGELGTCASSGCHVGAANAFPGSVTTNTTTYVPGVKQRITVTVADAAASQLLVTRKPTVEWSTYPLALIALPGQRLMLRLCYDESRFERNAGLSGNRFGPRVRGLQDTEADTQNKCRVVP